MCKEVDDTPKTSPAEDSISEHNSPPPTNPEPIHQPPPPEPEPEPVKEEKKIDPTWTQASLPPELPNPSVYSNTVVGIDPRLLSSSDENSSSINISEFNSQTSLSADRKLDRMPIK